MLSRVTGPLRRLWRRARGHRVTGAAIVAGDRLWWASTIRRAHIVDLDFVAAQLGRRVSERHAVRGYVRGGWRHGMSLNPLFCEQTVLRLLSDDERVPALYAYLVNDPADVQVSPNWDAPEYARRHAGALDDPAGPLGHAWRSARAGEPLLLGRGPRARALPWSDVARLARRAAGSGAAGRDLELTPSSSEGEGAASDVTAVWILAGDERDPGTALRQAIDLSEDPSTRLRVAVAGPSVSVWTQAALLTAWLPDTRVRLFARVDYEAALAGLTFDLRAGTLLTRGPHAEISTAGLRTLLDEGRTHPAAPLWLGPDGTIAAAGLAYRDGRPVPLLAGLPAEDARRLGDRLIVPDPAGRTLARPLGATSAEAQTLTDVPVIAPSAPPVPGPPRDDTPLERLPIPPGLALKGWDVNVPSYVRRREETTLPDGRRVPRLRWAIKTAAPVGRAGEAWGDTHFARGIAAALGRLGQDVAVDALPAAHRASDRLDDISLVLRGPHRIAPPPTGRSLLWVISHPDEMTPEELGAFDRVFAASDAWAARTSASTGIPVAGLLQCTDVRVFQPSGAPRRKSIVFVGTARGIARPSIVEPIRAGIPVEVYGPDWRAFIPARSIVATGVPHSALPELYGTAAVVLNDHWPAMQAQGFIANRPFDAIAAGGRVISDHVEGIDELFEGALRSYRSVPELLDLLRGDLDTLFPSEEELAGIGRRVRERHSFDERAHTLLNTALEVL